MSKKEGKSGKQECTTIMTTALVMTAVFSIKSEEMYSNGNSSYITVPISVAIALLAFWLTNKAMSRTKTENLYAMANYALGKGVGGALLIILITIMLLIIAQPFFSFISIMDSMLSPESMHRTVLIYMIIGVAVMALMGLEGILRASVLVGALLVVFQSILFISSWSGYNALNLAPIADDGALSIAIKSITGTASVIPAFIVLLETTKGVNGIKTARKSGLSAGIISIFIVLIIQLALGMSFTYDDLAEIRVPLHRLTMLTPIENFIFRLDKLSVFIWLMGIVLITAYYIYGTAHLYTSVFNQDSIKPTVLALCGVLVSICALLYYGNSTMNVIINTASKYGGIVMLGIIIILSLTAMLKKDITGRQKNEN